MHFEVVSVLLPHIPSLWLDWPTLETYIFKVTSMITSSLITLTYYPPLNDTW